MIGTHYGNPVIEARKTARLHAVGGKEGKSAYDYARKGGYTGSEEDFTALMGKFQQGRLMDEDVMNTMRDESRAFIVQELAKRGQLVPTFAADTEACVDTDKLYVLPDGYVYAYQLTETATEPSYKNQIPLSLNSDGSEYVGYNGEDGYSIGYRIRSNGQEEISERNCCTGFIPCAAGDTLRFKNIETESTGYSIPRFFSQQFTVVSTTEIHLYGDSFAQDENGVRSITVPDNSAIAYIRVTVGGLSDESVITVNEEITDEGSENVTEYRWRSTGHAFVPADYEDRILAMENTCATEEKKIAKLTEWADAVGVEMTLYMSSDGDDANDGKTPDSPKRTVSACLKAGATRISAKRGVYREAVQIRGIPSLEIFPTDNGQDYSQGETREPIVFELADDIAVADLTDYNGIKRAAYTVDGNLPFREVFVAKTAEPLVDEDGYGSRYRATVWLLSLNGALADIKLKPVLTVAECEAEENTFTYAEGYIYLNADVTDVARIAVPTNGGDAFEAVDVEKLVMREVETRFAGVYGLDLRNIPWFELVRCACKYTTQGSGFHPYNSNGLLTACYATRCYDGYGVSGFGHTTYVDCVAEYNYDDGVSHHNATEGTFIGGRYEGNGKGGNTPAYGARVNIYGGLYKNNGKFGIGYLYANGVGFARGTVQGAVMVGNRTGLSVNKNCPVIAMGCRYADNEQDRVIESELFVEY